MMETFVAVAFVVLLLGSGMVAGMALQQHLDRQKPGPVAVTMPAAQPSVTVGSSAGAAVVRWPDADTPTPPVNVRIPNGQMQEVPAPVVSACIRESGGNGAVFDRALRHAAQMLAQGVGVTEALNAVQRGEQVEA